MSDRATLIRETLEKALRCEMLEIVDDSHLHVGHEGARDGRSHFSIVIVSDDFRELRQLKRHRLIYDALGDLMTTDIHALRIKALTNDEI